MGLRGVGFLLQCYLVLAAGMYFDLGEQEEKCIIEEIPEDTLVTGHFLLEPWDLKAFTHSAHLGVTATVKDPNHEVQMSKRYGKFGKFTFTAHASGQHYLCFQTNSTRFSVFAEERLKLHLDVQMGEHSIDHHAVKTKDNMETLENSLTHLIDQMIYIARQQEYQREKEEVFRQISENTNGKVLWWAVVQTSILLSVGFWQMKRLKDFFVAKKLGGDNMTRYDVRNRLKSREMSLFQSSSEVKALFSDINVVATKHLTEISKVWSSNQSTLPNHSARSATVSRFQGLPVTPDIPYGQTSGWKSPIYRSPSASSTSFRHSMPLNPSTQSSTLRSKKLRGSIAGINDPFLVKTFNI
ncbi:Transmembrane emp24 domain-containing protein 11 [Collichthys lucidus]|uniref:Transmembrane emp24 domain-containing protein 11 n=1 Tax=Collichthys lucidus TaxID=240159 RepID=A0A4U5UED4_COLLU|nr:Transmembrane emp24 domain-containing protein 11 [Collichthys lucidus]